VEHLSSGEGNEQCRVLVVDDDHDGADMIAEAVEQFGYVTEPAYDGVTALAIADRFRPHVAIIDLGMPQMNGFEVARRLHALDLNIAIVVLSGFETDRYQAEARSAGIAHYLVKPVDLEALVRLLKSLCGGDRRRGPTLQL
jgi:DNA-binding response OmpR family regulator